MEEGEERQRGGLRGKNAGKNEWEKENDEIIDKTTQGKDRVFFLWIGYFPTSYRVGRLLLGKLVF